MANRRRLYLVLVLLLLVGGLLLVPQVRWPLYGWLRGEAFYQGMPTTWWQQEVRQAYRPAPVVGSMFRLEEMLKTKGGPRYWARHSAPGLWERIQSWASADDVTDSMSLEPPLLDGDKAALPVLLTLLRSDDIKVRKVAISGLASLKPPPSAVFPALLPLAQDDDEFVREHASWALQQIDQIAAAKAGIK